MVLEILQDKITSHVQETCKWLQLPGQPGGVVGHGGGVGLVEGGLDERDQQEEAARAPPEHLHQGQD